MLRYNLDLAKSKFCENLRGPIFSIIMICVISGFYINIKIQGKGVGRLGKETK